LFNFPGVNKSPAPNAGPKKQWKGSECCKGKVIGEFLYDSLV